MNINELVTFEILYQKFRILIVLEQCRVAWYAILSSKSCRRVTIVKYWFVVIFKSFSTKNLKKWILLFSIDWHFYFFCFSQKLHFLCFLSQCCIIPVPPTPTYFDISRYFLIVNEYCCRDVNEPKFSLLERVRAKNFRAVSSRAIFERPIFRACSSNARACNGSLTPLFTVQNSV